MNKELSSYIELHVWNDNDSTFNNFSNDTNSMFAITLKLPKGTK
jgi:hypothetical protein